MRKIVFFSVFIGIRVYPFLRLTSRSVLTCFLLCLGLNLTQGLLAHPMDGPRTPAGEATAKYPVEDFADLAATDGTLWVAGNALHRFRDGEWETVYEESRILALAHVPERGELWFAGTTAFGVIDLETGAHTMLPLSKGFIWDIVAMDGRLWYFAGRGLGWIDMETRSPGRFWAKDFSPRPFVMGPWSDRREILLGSDAGLAAVCPENGYIPVLQAVGDLNGQLITWAQPIPEGGYFFGSSFGAFRWDGTQGGRCFFGAEEDGSVYPWHQQRPYVGTPFRDRGFPHRNRPLGR